MSSKTESPWKPYIDNLLGSGKLSQALILGHQGGVGDQSSGFELSPGEVKAVISAHSKLDEVRSSGLRLAGQKYFTILANEDSIYLKNKGDGALIVKTNQVILVALYVAPVQAAEATDVVEKMARDLKDAGS